MPFLLLPEDSASIPDHWFVAQHRPSYEFPVYKACHEKEIAALKSFSNNEKDVDEAAHAITQPISTTSIQDNGDYSADCVALCRLWTLLTNALIEWPSSRTPDLMELLSAISKVTDPIHRGEFVSEDDETPLPWSAFPYLSMIWSDTFWMTPGQITRRVTDAISERQAHDLYFKQQDVDARLVAAGIFQWKRAFQYLICTLEKTPTPHDDRVADNDGDGDLQLKLTMQIPAVSRWVEHNGQRMYRSLLQHEAWYEHRRDIPLMALQFNQPVGRWAFWQWRYVTP